MSRLSDPELTVVHESLERCRRDAGFMGHFYDLFIGSSEEVAAKFHATDFRHQKRVLVASLYALVLAAEGRPEGRDHLHRIAALHDRQHHDVRSELYDRWLDCLLRAIADCDPQFSTDVERAWRAMLLPSIAVMKAAY